MINRLKMLAVVAAFGAAAAAISTATATSTSALPEAAKSGSAAPDFAGISNWLNSDPLTVQKLRGKVVLVDFWTYSCINCIHTLPYVKDWNQKYKDQGLTVVGVHTPEYPFERDTGNVKTAIRRLGVTWPVAQDNEYRTWNAYGNQYWPALYLIDRKGQIVYTHFGEGDYAQTDAAIQAALAQK
jgi:thiol-disulfide isomerase/thioredoxin